MSSRGPNLLVWRRIQRSGGSYLRVIAAGSSGTAARYVIDGGIRQAGSRLRVTVQLTDTITKAQLWVETYERIFDPDTIFDIQDDLVVRIVSTCADPSRHAELQGVLERQRPGRR